MIGYDGRVKIIDFGISQIIGVTGFTTHLERNRRYSAPELVPITEVPGGVQPKPTRRSDVYSFSMVLLQVDFLQTSNAPCLDSDDIQRS